jgi:hypothetical protein
MSRILFNDAIILVRHKFSCVITLTIGGHLSPIGFLLFNKGIVSRLHHVSKKRIFFFVANLISSLEIQLTNAKKAFIVFVAVACR